MRFLKTAAGCVGVLLMCGALSTPVMVVLKDGTRLVGSAGASLLGVGRFSVSNSNSHLTCSGSYNAFNPSPLISAKFTCSDGRGGMLAAERADALGMAGSGIMTFGDGDTAVFAFGVEISRLTALQAAAQAKAQTQAQPDDKSTQADEADKKERKPLPPPDTTPPDFPLNAAGVTMREVDVALEEAGGVFTAPVFINKSIELKFMVDSGATDVTIPADVVSTLIRAGAITDDDFIGTKDYQIADGSIAPSDVIRIRELSVGGVKLKNVVASVTNVEGPLLLGQSFLKRFGAWSLDNQRHVLVLRAPTPKV